MTTFHVEVSGSWRALAAPAGPEEPHTKRFQVLAPSPGAAEITGTQLFGAAAAGERCTVGACRARITDSPAP